MRQPSTTPRFRIAIAAQGVDIAPTTPSATAPLSDNRAHVAVTLTFALCTVYFSVFLVEKNARKQFVPMDTTA